MIRPERKTSVPGRERFQTSARHAIRDNPNDSGEWDEWTGDKKKGMFHATVGGFFHFIGTVVVACLLLGGVFYGLSFFWKMIFPAISK